MTPSMPDVVKALKGGKRFTGGENWRREPIHSPPIAGAAQSRQRPNEYSPAVNVTRRDVPAARSRQRPNSFSPAIHGGDRGENESRPGSGRNSSQLKPMLR
jgi:hypothetical protein